MRGNSAEDPGKVHTYPYVLKEVPIDAAWSIDNEIFALQRLSNWTSAAGLIGFHSTQAHAYIVTE